MKKTEAGWLVKVENNTPVARFYCFCKPDPLPVGNYIWYVDPYPRDVDAALCLGPPLHAFASRVYEQDCPAHLKTT